VPWQAETISMATHKTNVYIDLSGWRPKYFPPELVRAAGGLLHDKVMFGSDYPLIAPERWLADYDELGIDPVHRVAILKGTAARVLGLS
jgi:predicted TIM-barrel fold metal-dependent hydrolase